MKKRIFSIVLALSLVAGIGTENVMLTQAAEPEETVVTEANVMAEETVAEVVAQTPETVKAATTYTVSGFTDDAIQEQLDKAKNGATIIVSLPAGTYYLDETLHIYSNTSMVLASGATIKRASGFENVMIMNGDWDDTAGGYTRTSNISLSGGVWDGACAGTTKGYNNIYFGHATGVTIKNTTVKNCYAVHLVELTGVKDAVIENVTFTGFQKSGDAEEDAYKEALQFDVTTETTSELFLPYDNTHCQNITVTNCKFMNYPSGVGTHSSVSGVYANNIIISGNTFENIPTRPISAVQYTNTTIQNNVQVISDGTKAETFVYIKNSAGKVNGNTVIGTTASGITIEGKASMTASGNTISNCGENGIYIAEASKAITSNNTISNCTLSGIRATDNSTINATGEKISNCVNSGFFVSNSAVSLKNNSITKCYNAGIHLEYPVSTSANQAIINGNTVNTVYNNKTEGNTGVGIAVYGGNANTIVSQNTVTSSTGAGITISKGNGNVVKNNQISLAGENGIYITDSSVVTTSGNTIKNCKLSGVRIAQGSNAIVSYSTITGCQNCGIYMDKSTVTATSNNITGCLNAGISLDAPIAATISQNTIQNSTTANGISVVEGTSSTKISGNTIKNIGNYPIIVVGANGTIIDANTISDFVEFGIYVRESYTNVKTSSVTVSNNKVTGGKVGIAVRNSNGPKITGNTATGAADGDFLIYENCSNSVVTNNKYSNEKKFFIVDKTAQQSGNGLAVTLNGLQPGADGKWYYYTNNAVNTSYTGMAPYGGNWYYVNKGVLDTSYTGLCYYGGTWWYVQNGVLNLKYTGLAPYGGNWWYVQNGVLNLKATGLTQYGGSWWYVQNGVLNLKATGLVPFGGSWWYVQNGCVNFKATGLTQYGGSWWYVQNGCVNFKATGLVPFGGNWWYVQNGSVNFKYTGLAPYGGAWWYVQNGALNLKYTGTATYGGATYRVVNGKVVF